MTDLLALSDAVLDGTVVGGEAAPMARITYELSELGDGIAIVEGFSHCVLFESPAGLVVFDTSNVFGGRRAIAPIREWRNRPFHALVYTHGHLDHVGGSGAFIADAEERGDERPRVVGHENVEQRFDRYEFTSGWNLAINERQFGSAAGLGVDPDDPRFLAASTAWPDVTYRDAMTFDAGGLTIELNHARGETDDHTWAWIPEHKAICAGDFFIWAFPNAGNPQKVQRYPLEWAAALRAMAAKGAELFIPAHGLPIGGAGRIATVLETAAGALEHLVQTTVQMMNDGALLDEIVHQVKVAPEVLELPYLRPIYDEPEFVVRNIWREYGGWWDGNPANLKPAPQAELAAELASLCGGAEMLAERAVALAETDIRLACHLVEFAYQAAPENGAVREARASVYDQRVQLESSLMSRAIFRNTAQATE